MDLDNHMFEHFFSDNGIFNLINYFQINFDQAESFKTKKENYSKSFKEFLKQSEPYPFSRKLKPYQEDYFQKINRLTLDRYYLFLLNLPLNAIDDNHLAIFFKRFFKDLVRNSKEFNKVGLQGYGQIICNLLLIVRNKDLTNIHTIYETELLRLINSQCDLGKIELLNDLILCYILLGELHRTKGFIPPIFNRYAQLLSHTSIHIWEGLTFEKKQQYFLLNIVGFLSFFPYEQPIYNSQFELDLISFLSIFSEAESFFRKAGMISHASIFRSCVQKIEDAHFNTKYLNQRRALESLSLEDQALKTKILIKFSSYRYPVTIERLDSYLMQFETTQKIQGILKILDNVKYFPLWQLSEIIDDIFLNNLNHYKDLRVTTLGEATGSSQILGYLNSHSRALISRSSVNIHYSENVKESIKLTTEEDPLVFLDDCIISGTQTINTINELFGMRELEPHHQIHCEKLIDSDIESFKKRKLIFIFCVGTLYGKDKLEKLLSDYNIDHSVYIGHYSDLNNKVFTPNNDIGWSSKEERLTLKEFCKTKGFEALEEISILKKWDQKDTNRRSNSALGYDDLQRLLVFPYSIPKTTLPILWCRSKNWMPLFETPD